MNSASRSQMRPLLAVLGALVLVLSLTACGDDDSAASDDGDDTEATADGDDSEETADGGADGQCDGNTATGTYPGGSFTSTDAAGVSLGGGTAVTLYITDFELSEDDFSVFSRPEVPDGDTLFTVAVTVFNAEDPDALEPLTPGEEIGIADEWGELTFVVTAEDADGQYGNAMDAEGAVTLTAVGDTFCGTVSYTDPEKSIEGTFEAPTRAA